MLEEPLLHDHMVHRFLDPSDLTMADPANPGMATPAWWGDGGDLAPEVGLLTRNIVIQGEGIGVKVHWSCLLFLYVSCHSCLSES